MSDRSTVWKSAEKRFWMRPTGVVSNHDTVDPSTRASTSEWRCFDARSDANIWNRNDTPKVTTTSSPAAAYFHMPGPLAGSPACMSSIHWAMKSDCMESQADAATRKTRIPRSMDRDLTADTYLA